MELDTSSAAKQPGSVMAAVTYVCSIAHAATLLGEDPELLEAIVNKDDNMTYGNIVNVQIGHENYITALTSDGIEELRDMITNARVSIKEWHRFIYDFVAETTHIARVKNQTNR